MSEATVPVCEMGQAGAPDESVVVRKLTAFRDVTERLGQQRNHKVLGPFFFIPKKKLDEFEAALVDLCGSLPESYFPLRGMYAQAESGKVPIADSAKFLNQYTKASVAFNQELGDMLGKMFRDEEEKKAKEVPDADN